MQPLKGLLRVFPNRKEAPTVPKIHTFESTGEAYDASQTGYLPDDYEDPEGDFDARSDAFEAAWVTVQDGDVLVVASEKVVGVLVEAWPVAAGTLHGAFHTHSEEWDWSKVPCIAGQRLIDGEVETTYEDRDYSESYGLAVGELLKLSVAS